MYSSDFLIVCNQNIKKYIVIDNEIKKKYKMKKKIHLLIHKREK